MLLNEKSLLSLWLRRLAKNAVLLVQSSGSPPQRAHTTTNRTQTSGGRSNTADRGETASKRCDNTRRLQGVSTLHPLSQPFLLDLKAVSAYN